MHNFFNFNLIEQNNVLNSTRLVSVHATGPCLFGPSQMSEYGFIYFIFK